uniref:Phospholipid-transporting ATPase n=1 Tax=Ursus americanus TaxID=9643 RepID=A0A452QL95_URSAM
MQRAPANSGSRPCIPQRHNPCCWRPEGGREGGAPPAWAAMPRARGLSFQSNVIHTAKYNVFSFLPLSLYEQFHRVSNLYFLFIIILQGFPEISTLPWFTLFAPLVCLLTIRATRDLVDDIVSVAGGRGLGRAGVGEGQGGRRQSPPMNLCVGDLVCLHRDNIVPADLLLLASTEPSSLCYVETADIDGETNLKFRQAPPVTHLELTSIRNMASFQGKVVCEEPNSRMHHFVGCLEWNGRKHPLDSGNMLLRGCRVRNTDTCYGIVIYAGFDTKIMKNCGRIHQKRTKIDRLMNKLVMLIFVSLVLISMALSFGFWFKVREFKAKHHYVSSKHLYSVAAETFLIFWGFLTQLSVMVPMAIVRCRVEFIYLGNSIFINWDVQMYHAPQDEPAKARSTSLNDQLGQVEYIFSDKTGTLTQNVMTFKKCCIGGVIYGGFLGAGSRAEENPYLWNKFADGKLLYRNERLLCAVRHNEDKVVREFWRLLAICHTVMVQEKDSEYQLVYQAASPDEEALVTAARNFGYVFLARTQDSITVMELGEERVYQVLAMMDFNSIRKRMSVLVRNPEGSIYLYTKGADMVIFERLHKKGMKEWATEEALETLRTLCLAYKEVDEDMYEEWRQRHQEASILLQNRAHALHQVYEEMEQGLQLLGATAIEDRLQDGVCDTIKCLKQGNIKVWVLTGDKQETAVNIGFACQLMNGDGDESWQEPDEQRKDFLRARRVSLMWRTLGIQLRSTGLAPQVTNSDTSESPEVRRERAFVELASQCQAVICCRVTPKQKALIVALVKKYQRVVTLAIGDGANDINMIKTADIGVGLAGQEGMQAVQNSDYALAQFCFLKRLLLVHGRWSYVRVCKFLRCFIYKTVASMMVQVWFAFYSGFTAQPLYEGWFLALFNLLYSTLPVLYIGLFEQDVSAERSLELPQLYTAGQKDELFNYWVFLQALAHGTVTSLVNFFVTLWVSHDSAGPVSFSDYQSFAVVVAMSGLLSITMEVERTQTGSTQAGRGRSVVAKGSSEWCPLGAGDLGAALALQEVEEAPSEEIITVEPGPYLHRGSRGRRSSYAFSHREGYADLITQGTSLRKAPGVHSDMLVADTIPSEEELTPGVRPSFRFSRKMSLLGRRKQPRQAEASAEETQPAGPASTSAAADRQRGSDQHVAAPEARPRGSVGQSPPRKRESAPPPSGGPAQPSGPPSLGGQPALPENGSLWKIPSLSWTSWSYSWQKLLQLPGEGPEPPPGRSPPEAGPTPPPAAGESPTDGPPTRGEPSPSESRLSPT